MLNHKIKIFFLNLVDTNFDDRASYFSLSVAFMRFIFKFTFTYCVLFEFPIIVILPLKVNGPAKVNVSPSLLVVDNN